LKKPTASFNSVIITREKAWDTRLLTCLFLRDKSGKVMVENKIYISANLGKRTIRVDLLASDLSDYLVPWEGNV
jgi:hypothetical protein